MVPSAIGFIEQQAIGQINLVSHYFSHLQKMYDETGDEEYRKCRDRIMAFYQQAMLAGAPASENNSEAGRFVGFCGPPASGNNILQGTPAKAVKRGRPRRNAENVGKAFIYKAHTKAETNQRLQSLYLALLQLRWISDSTQQRDFVDLFSGGDSTVRVIWTDDVNTLAELFRQLVRREYVALPSGLSIWVMVNAHFWDKKGNQAFGNDRLRTTHTPIEKMDIIRMLVRMLDPYQDLMELAKELANQRKTSEVDV